MPYCPKCGSQTEEGAAFCSDCGERLEEQAAAPEQQPPTPGPAAKAGTTPWTLLGGLVVAGGLVLGLVALYDAAANDGDWADSIFGGGGGEDTTVAALSPTPEETAQPSPTVKPSPTVEPSPTEVPPRRATVRPASEPTATPAPGPTVTPPPEQPTVAPPPSGYTTPEDAIGAYLADLALPYVGDCEFASLDTDVGYYCSFLWEDRFDTLIYTVGLTFSEPDTWLLLAPLGAGDDWVVMDTAEFVPGPQDTVPPW